MPKMLGTHVFAVVNPRARLFTSGSAVDALKDESSSSPSRPRPAGQRSLAAAVRCASRSPPCTVATWTAEVPDGGECGRWRTQTGYAITDLGPTGPAPRARRCRHVIL